MATERVAAQYAAYPYPERAPADETRRLVLGSPSDLGEVIHYVFGGRRERARPLNALAAGGGTGDGAIMLAQQMADAGVPGTVTHLDISAAAQAIARRRAEVRGLANLRFVAGSLLDLARVAPGPYDYIDCCGVLHHLDDPPAGLAALAGALAPDGGIGLMVYGTVGRTGVYHVQELLRTLAPGELDDAERLAIARRLVDALPATNWLVRNSQVSDHRDGGDAGLYDLLLCARDRAYTVPELARLVAGAGLRITSFIEPIAAMPARLVGDPRLARAVGDLDMHAAAAFVELYAGNRKQHTVYCVAATNDVALPTPVEAAIPAVRGMPAADLAAALPAGGVLKGALDGMPLDLPLPPLARAFVARCDGATPLAAIYDQVAELRRDLDRAAIARQFAELYQSLNAVNRMVLRYP